MTIEALRERTIEENLKDFRSFCQTLKLLDGKTRNETFYPNKYQESLFVSLLTGGKTFQTVTQDLRGKGTTTLVCAYIAWRCTMKGANFKVAITGIKSEWERAIIVRAHDFVTQAFAAHSGGFQIVSSHAFSFTTNNGCAVVASKKTVPSFEPDFNYAEIRKGEYEIADLVAKEKVYAMIIDRVTEIADHSIVADESKEVTLKRIVAYDAQDVLLALFEGKTVGEARGIVDRFFARQII